MPEKNIYTGHTAANGRRRFEQFAEKRPHSEANKHIVNSFVEDYSLVKSIKELTQLKYYRCLKKFIEIADINLQDFTTKQIKSVLADLVRSDYSEHTKSTHVNVLKVFAKWMRKMSGREHSDEMQQALEFLDEYSFRMDRNKMEDQPYITLSEVQSIIGVAEDIRDKVLFAMMWSSGARIGEILTLQVDDVKPFKYGFRVHIRESKTKKRTVPIVDEKETHTTRIIRIWLQHRKNNPLETDRFFLNQNDKPLIHSTATKHLKKTLEHAGIKKPITFKAFRSGRATHLANKGWSETRMCKLHGWVPGSNMPRIYINKAGVDVTQTLAEMHGLEEPEEQEDTMQECPRCQALNDPSHEFCSLCSSPLDAHEAIKRDEEEQDLLERMVREKMPDILEKLKKEYMEDQA